MSRSSTRLTGPPHLSSLWNKGGIILIIQVYHNSHSARIQDTALLAGRDNDIHNSSPDLDKKYFWAIPQDGFVFDRPVTVTCYTPPHPTPSHPLIDTSNTTQISPPRLTKNYQAVHEFMVQGYVISLTHAVWKLLKKIN